MKFEDLRDVIRFKMREINAQPDPTLRAAVDEAMLELHRAIEADFRQQLRELGTHRLNVVAVQAEGGPSYDGSSNPPCLLYPRAVLCRLKPRGWVAPLP